MQQLFRLANVSSPAILIVVVWLVMLVVVGLGPIDYPGQPSPAVLVLVAAGLSIFILGHSAGSWCFGNWFQRQATLAAPSFGRLEGVVLATSLVGIGGIGLIALDRLVLSGVSNGGYAELLRCAPGLVDFIEIRRTPLLYVGYLTFSFGFASLALFLLKGEEIRGWPAVAAQLSIACPIGYALLYSGRMPILFAIVLIVSVVLIRISQGRSSLPHGHYLLLKTVIVVLLFALYSSAVWSRRANFCAQMSGVIQELELRKAQRDNEQAEAKRAQEPKTEAPRSVHGPGSISATDVTRMITDANEPASSAAGAVGSPASELSPKEALLARMRESWNVQPRAYVLSAMNSGTLSPRYATSILSSYFYLTHGIRVIDMTWQARERFSPHWGVYEIGILSPIRRVFFPQDRSVADMEAQLSSAGIFGFYPTAWASAFIDFGAVGSIVYVLIWGFAAGWSVSGARRSTLILPPLLLTFILASIFLSPIQGPLGIANSAMVLFSMIATGAAVDFRSFARTPGGLIRSA
jgi:hypothetical protein